MKIGQLVMLIRTMEGLPPTGATGEIHSECCMSNCTRVMFAQHKNETYQSDGAFCVKRAWLIPIDDHKGKIAAEDQLTLDIGDGDRRTVKELADMARKMLEDEPA